MRANGWLHDRAGLEAFVARVSADDAVRLVEIQGFRRGEVGADDAEPHRVVDADQGGGSLADLTLPDDPDGMDAGVGAPMELGLVVGSDE